MTTLVQVAYDAVDSKHGQDIIVLDMEGISVMTDHMIICHANSDRQVQAIAREVGDAASKAGYSVQRTEGFQGARWILVDLGDVIVHVFHRDEREHYNLERLWRDAPTVDLVPTHS
ncbi:ribosome silencing factor [Planococcaceae bacterium Storch 2/2-2]|nr:ribosome silencing factor [Planococcaceae bacterium Storch 2/2-2]